MMNARRQETDLPDEYDPQAVMNLANKRLAKIDQITSPMKIKILNAAQNMITSVRDIQLW